MLILLSGSEAIAKPLIAREVVKKLNEPFTVEGLSVTYDIEGNEILSKDGEVVTYPDIATDPETGAALPGAAALREALNNKYLELNSLAEDNNVMDFFVDIGYDFGIHTERTYTNFASEATVTKTIDDVVANYNASTVNNFVVSGIFSNIFIDDLKARIGSENVTVINITRNPSVAFFMHSVDEEFFDNDDQEKLINSMLNAIKLKQQGYTTIKYEDIIAGQSITINGTEIPLPDTFASVNGIINAWENENLPTKTADDVANFNAQLSPLDPTLVGADNSSTYDNLKLDIFTELSYTALTHAEIIAS